MALFAFQQGVRGGGRGKDEFLPRLEAQLVQPRYDLPARLSGGVGHVAVRDAGLFEMAQGFEGARDRPALIVERPVEVYEQAPRIHKKSSGGLVAQRCCALTSPTARKRAWRQDSSSPETTSARR